MSALTSRAGSAACGERLEACIEHVLRRTRLARLGQAGSVGVTAGLVTLSVALVTGISPTSTSALVAGGLAGLCASLAYFIERAPSARRVASKLDRELGLDGALRTAVERLESSSAVDGRPSGVSALLVSHVERRLDPGRVSAVVPATVIWLAPPLVAFAGFALGLESWRRAEMSIDPGEHWRALAADMEGLVAEGSPTDGSLSGEVDSAGDGTTDPAADLERITRRLDREALRLENSTDRAEIDAALRSLEEEVGHLQRRLAGQPDVRRRLDRTRARMDALRTGLGLKRSPAGPEGDGAALAGGEPAAGGVTSGAPAGTMGDPPSDIELDPTGVGAPPRDVGVPAGRPWPRRYDAVIEAFVGTPSSSTRTSPSESQEDSR